jgi:hypothetical protein
MVLGNPSLDSSKILGFFIRNIAEKGMVEVTPEFRNSRVSPVMSYSEIPPPAFALWLGRRTKHKKNRINPLNSDNLN